SNVHVFIHRRHYAYLILLNGRESQWQAPALRRALNQAIDRPRLVGDGLQGHAVAADGPVWPDHWAYDATLPRFTYEPADAEAAIRRVGKRLHFTCGFPAYQPFDGAVVAVQRQLRSVGVDRALEALTYDEFVKRLTDGNFQAMLADAVIAPTLFRESQWWYSNARRNYGGYRSAAVDAAFDAIRRS